MRNVPVISLLALVAAVGCGGGTGHERKGEADAGCERISGESAREACEKQQIAKQIPAADRIAYYQLATTAGLLRANAVAAARSGRVPVRAGSAELAAAASRLGRLAPRDGVLKLVLARIRPLLREARAGFNRGAAQSALLKLRAIDRALSRYVRYREPAQAALVPD